MLNHLPLNEIIDGCRQGKPGYWAELCRRAFDEKNEEALNAVHDLLSDFPLNEIIDGCKQDKPKYDAELCRRAFDDKNDEALNAVYDLLNDLPLNRVYDLLRYFPLSEIIDGCKKNKPEYYAELCRRAFDEKNEEALNAVYDLLNDLPLNRVYDLLRYFPLNDIIHGCRQQKRGYCFELFRRAFDEKDKEAARILYNQYNRLVFDWVFKSLKGYRLSEQDVEDIASEANFKFFKYMMKSVPLTSRYKHIGQLLAYWRTCVRTTVIDFLRKRGREDQIMERWVQEILTDRYSKPSPDEGIEKEECRQKIRELLKKNLSNKEMRYLILKFVEGLTRAEIAKRYPDEFPVEEQDKIWDRVKKRLRKIFKIYLRDCY